MAFTTVPTVATGDTWSASQHNTYVRDNIAALWPYATAGDIAYATSSSVLGRIAIGAEGYKLSASASTPTWVEIVNTKMAFVKKITSQNITSGGENKAISFDTEVYDNNNYFAIGSPTLISFSTQGWYRFTGWVSFSLNASGYRAIYIETIPVSIRQPAKFNQSSHNFVTYYYKTDSSSVNWHLYVNQNSGSTLTAEANLLIEYLGT